MLFCLTRQRISHLDLEYSGNFFSLESSSGFLFENKKVHIPHIGLKWTPEMTRLSIGIFLDT